MNSDTFLRLDEPDAEKYGLVSYVFDSVICWKGGDRLRFTQILIKDAVLEAFSENDVLGQLMDKLDVPTEIWSPSQGCVDAAKLRGWEYCVDTAGSPYVSNLGLFTEIQKQENDSDKPSNQELEIDDLFF